MNANGIVSFVYPFDDSVIHPLPLTGNNNKIIAPYWADVDTRGTGNIYYRQTTDPGFLNTVTEQIRTAFPNSQVVSVDNILIATWDRVGYYPERTDKVNNSVIFLIQNSLAPSCEKECGHQKQTGMKRSDIKGW